MSDKATKDSMYDLGMSRGLDQDIGIGSDAGAVAVERVLGRTIPGESNYLINPGHAMMAKVKVAAKRRFAFDPRII